MFNLQSDFSAKCKLHGFTWVEGHSAVWNLSQLGECNAWECLDVDIDVNCLNCHRPNDADGLVNVTDSHLLRKSSLGNGARRCCYKTPTGSDEWPIKHAISMWPSVTVKVIPTHSLIWKAFSNTISCISRAYSCVVCTKIPFSPVVFLSSHDLPKFV